jgi:hypothetical protein
MIANIADPHQTTKPILTVVHKSQLTDLEKFYRGFPCYWPLWVDEDGVTYALPSCHLTEPFMLKASAYIDDNNLNLEVISTGKRSTTFIIKEREVTNA